MGRLIKRIHQIWDKENFPKDFEKHQLSIKNNHLDWEYNLWDLNKCRNLIKEEYNYFLKTFDNYKFDIERIDAARFFILDNKGGVYADLDIFFYKNIENLLIDKKAVFFKSFDGRYISNGIMYNNNSLFLKKIVKHLRYIQKLFYDKNETEVMNVLNANGQRFLYNYYQTNKYDSILLDSKYFEFYDNITKYKNEDFIYGIHEQAGMWFDKNKVLV